MFRIFFVTALVSSFVLASGAVAQQKTIKDDLNVAGPNEQKRIITSLTEQELKFTNPRTPAGITLYTVWKRAKSP